MEIGWNPCSLWHKVGNPVCPISSNWVPTEKTMNKGMAPKCLPTDLAFDHTWAQPQLLASTSSPLT